MKALSDLRLRSKKAPIAYLLQDMIKAIMLRLQIYRFLLAMAGFCNKNVSFYSDNTFFTLVFITIIVMV